MGNAKMPLVLRTLRGGGLAPTVDAWGRAVGPRLLSQEAEDRIRDNIKDLITNNPLDPQNGELRANGLRQAILDSHEEHVLSGIPWGLVAKRMLEEINEYNDPLADGNPLVRLDMTSLYFDDFWGHGYNRALEAISRGQYPGGMVMVSRPSATPQNALGCKRRVS